MTLDKAKKLKPGTWIVWNLKHKNRIWGSAVGTVHVASNDCGYFTQMLPYKDIPLPIMNWADYRPTTVKEREHLVLWKLENS